MMQVSVGTCTFFSKKNGLLQSNIGQRHVVHLVKAFHPPSGNGFLGGVALADTCSAVFSYMGFAATKVIGKRLKHYHRLGIIVFLCL